MLEISLFKYRMHLHNVIVKSNKTDNQINQFPFFLFRSISLSYIKVKHYSICITECYQRWESNMYSFIHFYFPQTRITTVVTMRFIRCRYVKEKILRGRPRKWFFILIIASVGFHISLYLFSVISSWLILGEKGNA